MGGRWARSGVSKNRAEGFFQKGAKREARRDPAVRLARRLLGGGGRVREARAPAAEVEGARLHTCRESTWVSLSVWPQHL